MAIITIAGRIATTASFLLLASRTISQFEIYYTMSHAREKSVGR
jgi:hypothetical protein